MVGREAELAQLSGYWETALRGDRQLVFVTGEPGIGKTTVVGAFLTRLADDHEHEHDLWLGRGQCIEQYGAGEAYMPLLEALGRLCREPGGDRLRVLLTQYAPTWLVQMPALLSATDYEALQRKTQGATRERMLRELAEALEAITAEQPLILVLEDLHWSDPSTLDLLSIIARRPEPARLLVIGTYRPVDVIVREHPLKTIKAELQLHHHCQELALEPLSEAQVAEYLAQRWAEPSRDRQGAEQAPRADARGSDTLSVLARLIHQRTEGNPLFVVSVMDDLMARGVVVQTDRSWELKEEAAPLESRIPDTIRQLVTLQSGRLSSEEQQTLAAASIAGMEFSAAAVAAALATKTAVIERHCEHLAERQQFLRRLGVEEWPDGTLAARYGFVHAVYQQVWHERVSPTQLQHYHLRIGERKEQAYGKRAREIATELAIHFEQGREYRRAVQHLEQAARNALRRSAYQEVLDLLKKGLALLKTLPDTAERVQQELRLQMMLTTPLIVLRGYTDPEVEQACTRAKSLCEQIGETPRLFSVLGGLFSLHYNRGQLRTALELAQQLLRLAQETQDRRLLLWAHFMLGVTLENQGDPLSARTHFEQSLALYDPQPHPSSYGFAQDPGTTGLTRLAWALYSLGYSDQALKKNQEALSLARQLAHPFSLAQVLWYAVEIHQHRGEHHAAQELEEELVTLSHEQGFSYWSTEGAIRHAWTLTRQGQIEEGLAQLRQTVATLQTRGEEIALPYALYRLADAYGQAGNPEEGLRIVTKAFVVVCREGRRQWEATLYHQKGTLLLQKADDKAQKGKAARSLTNSRQHLESEAEACFQKAIELARQQRAKSDELRMVISLARLWQQQGKRRQAHTMLAEIYSWFTEGFDTKDLQEAKVLLDVLSEAC